VVCGMDISWFFFRVESTEDKELYIRILNSNREDKNAVMVSRNEKGLQGKWVKNNYNSKVKLN
jgi:hypothetical protein